MKWTKIYSLIAILLVSAGIVACSSNNEQKKLNISAAASLKDALDEICELYQEDNPGTDIQCNYASSGKLMTQIEEGAPADIFISASTEQTDELSEQGLILHCENLLENTVVLITGKNDSSDITNFKELEDVQGLIAVGDPNSVPAGNYAKQIFERLEIADKISTKLCYASDVREVLSWVQTQNADYGIVYKTDAKSTDKVKILAEADDSICSRPVYPAAVLKNSTDKDEAEKFFDFLKSKEATEVFETEGFGVIKASSQ
jgi:molybdate transport system substrate-binding protein